MSASEQKALIFDWLFAGCDKTVSTLAGTGEEIDLPAEGLCNYKLAYDLSRLLHFTEEQDPLIAGLNESAIRKFLLLRAIFFLD